MPHKTKKVVKASFQGEDGSMGLRAGAQYELYLHLKGEMVKVSIYNNLNITVEYSTFIKFLDNWTDIKS